MRKRIASSPCEFLNFLLIALSDIFTSIRIVCASHLLGYLQSSHVLCRMGKAHSRIWRFCAPLKKILIFVFLLGFARTTYHHINQHESQVQGLRKGQARYQSPDDFQHPDVFSLQHHHIATFTSASPKAELLDNGSMQTCYQQDTASHPQLLGPHTFKAPKHLLPQFKYVHAIRKLLENLRPIASLLEEIIPILSLICVQAITNTTVFVACLAIYQLQQPLLTIKYRAANNKLVSSILQVLNAICTRQKAAHAKQDAAVTTGTSHQARYHGIQIVLLTCLFSSLKIHPLGAHIANAPAIQYIYLSSFELLFAIVILTPLTLLIKIDLIALVAHTITKPTKEKTRGRVTFQLHMPYSGPKAYSPLSRYRILTTQSAIRHKLARYQSVHIIPKWLKKSLAWFHALTKSHPLKSCHGPSADKPQDFCIWPLIGLLLCTGLQNHVVPCNHALWWRHSMEFVVIGSLIALTTWVANQSTGYQSRPEKKQSETKPHSAEQSPNPTEGKENPRAAISDNQRNHPTYLHGDLQPAWQQGGAPGIQKHAKRGYTGQPANGKAQPLADVTRWTRLPKAWMANFEMSDVIKFVLEPTWTSNGRMLSQDHFIPDNDRSFIAGLSSPTDSVPHRIVHRMGTEGISPYFILNPGESHWRIITIDTSTSTIYYIVTGELSLLIQVQVQSTTLTRWGEQTFQALRLKKP